MAQGQAVPRMLLAGKVAKLNLLAQQLGGGLGRLPGALHRRGADTVHAVARNPPADCLRLP